VFELLPDDYYFNTLQQYIIDYVGRSGRPRKIQLASVTYQHPRYGLDPRNPPDPEAGILDTRINNALDFKRKLGPAVRGDPAKVLRARLDAEGLVLHARTATPGWLGERLDVGWAIDVLHPLAR